MIRKKGKRRRKNHQRKKSAIIAEKKGTHGNYVRTRLRVGVIIARKILTTQKIAGQKQKPTKRRNLSLAHVMDLVMIMMSVKIIIGQELQRNTNNGARYAEWIIITPTIAGSLKNNNQSETQEVTIITITETTEANRRNKTTLQKT